MSIANFKKQLIEYIKTNTYIINGILLSMWWWVWFGLQITKAVEFMFKMILRLPNKWLNFSMPSIKNTKGKSFDILSASNEAGDITNKLKLILRYYWEIGGEDQLHDTNGFDVRKLDKLLDSSLLCCDYLIYKNPEIIEGIYKFIIKKTSNGWVKYTNDNLSNLVLGHVDFDGDN